jgi:hypothetical protein
MFSVTLQTEKIQKHKMKLTLREFFLFLTLVVFLAGTTGVSFYIHECSSSHKRDIFVYPEISNKTASCCCADEVHGSINSEERITSFKEPECCKNTHVYLKASFTGFPVFYQFDQKLLQAPLPADFLNLSINDKEPATVDFTLPVDHPPPRYGKALVHFLHQIKIPASVS